MNKTDNLARKRRELGADNLQSPQTVGMQMMDRGDSITKGLIRYEASGSPAQEVPMRISSANGGPFEHQVRLAPQNSPAYQDYVAKVNNGDQVADSSVNMDSRRPLQAVNDSDNQL